MKFEDVLDEVLEKFGAMASKHYELHSMDVEPCDFCFEKKQTKQLLSKAHKAEVDDSVKRIIKKRKSLRG